MSSAFSRLKNKFFKALKEPAQRPRSGFVEMGEYTGRGFESEGSYNILVDPEGDAWMFMGNHAELARQIKQEDDAPEVTNPAVRTLRGRVRAAQKRTVQTKGDAVAPPSQAAH